MSTLTTDPGFNRGAVLGILWKAYDAENGDGSNVIGVRKSFKDENPRDGTLYSNRTVECIAVRNSSGTTLAPGAVVKFKLAPTSGIPKGGILGEVDGLAGASDKLVGVVDEYLTSAVPAGEIFWVVVRGPSTVTKTSTAITAGDTVSTTATAGSVATGTTNTLVGFAINDAALNTTSGRLLVRAISGY